MLRRVGSEEWRTRKKHEMPRRATDPFGEVVARYVYPKEHRRSGEPGNRPPGYTPMKYLVQARAESHKKGASS